MRETISLLEALAACAILDVTFIGMALLLARLTGRRIPPWVGPRWLVDRLNGWIDPDPRRFDRVAARLVARLAAIG